MMLKKSPTTNSNDLIWLSIGSNVGKSLKNIQDAFVLLEKNQIHIKKYAPLYTTAPIGPQNQQDFLNTVIAVETHLNPVDLLNKIKKIELEIGRIKRQHWGPREIDIDIIFYKDTIFNSQTLIIPHIEMQNREFVLLPMAQIAPNMRHPKTNKTIKELLEYYYENLQRDTRSARLFDTT